VIQIKSLSYSIRNQLS